MASGGDKVWWRSESECSWGTRVQWQTGDLSREMSGLEEKQASAATPARQNLNFIYGAKNTQTPAANASRADSQPSSGDGGNAGGGAAGGGTAGGGAAANTGSDEEEMSEADQLRQRLVLSCLV